MLNESDIVNLLRIIDMDLDLINRCLDHGDTQTAKRMIEIDREFISKTTTVLKET